MTPGEFILWVLVIFGAIILLCIAILAVVGLVRQLRVYRAEDKVVADVKRWAASGPPEPSASERGKGSQK